MKTRSHLLATASGIAAAAAAGGVHAADMGVPMKAAPPIPPAAPTWTGFYIGGNLGAAWQQANTQGTGYQGGTFHTAALSNSTTTTGFIGGGQIGYNWQRGNAVYGVEADFSGLTGTGSVTQPYIAASKCFACNATTTNKVDWVATFRGRLGLAVNDTLVYATAGLAVGRVSNNFGFSSQYSSSSGTLTGTWSDHSTRTGLAVGGGVEQMLTPNWTVRLEAMFVDLGRKTVNFSSGNSVDKTSHLTATFSNQIVLGRVGLNYKF